MNDCIRRASDLSGIWLALRSITYSVYVLLTEKPTGDGICHANVHCFYNRTVTDFILRKTHKYCVGAVESTLEFDVARALHRSP